MNCNTLTSSNTWLLLSLLSLEFSPFSYTEGKVLFPYEVAYYLSMIKLKYNKQHIFKQSFMARLLNFSDQGLLRLVVRVISLIFWRWLLKGLAAFWYLELFYLAGLGLFGGAVLRFWLWDTL